jgi:Cupin-like domain
VRAPRRSRSSLHYDPYQNLLCCVTGAKHVTLMSPAATRFLYPLPVFGESPNHSAVDFARPDLDRHPLYARALPGRLLASLQACSGRRFLTVCLSIYMSVGPSVRPSVCLSVCLSVYLSVCPSVSLSVKPNRLPRRAVRQAGDALFVPEGWWHQVDSVAGTIAVNFWWRSAFERLIGGHMDAYFLRRLAGGLVYCGVDERLAVRVMDSPRAGRAVPHGARAADRQTVQSTHRMGCMLDGARAADRQTAHSAARRRMRGKLMLGAFET